MRDMQTVTIYYQVVYALAAVIFGAYAAWIASAASRARARLEAKTPRQ